MVNVVQLSLVIDRKYQSKKLKLKKRLCTAHKGKTIEVKLLFYQVEDFKIGKTWTNNIIQKNLVSALPHKLDLRKWEPGELEPSTWVLCGWDLSNWEPCE